MSSTEVQVAYPTRLRAILAEQERSAAWLGRRIGLSRQRVNDFCNGLHVPDDRKAAIAKALGREIGDVFPERGDLAA